MFIFTGHTEDSKPFSNSKYGFDLGKAMVASDLPKDGQWALTDLEKAVQDSHYEHTYDPLKLVEFIVLYEEDKWESTMIATVNYSESYLSIWGGKAVKDLTREMGVRIEWSCYAD